MLNWLVYKKNNDLPEDVAIDLVAGFVDKDGAENFALILEKTEDDPRYTYYIKNVNSVHDSLMISIPLYDLLDIAHLPEDTPMWIQEEGCDLEKIEDIPYVIERLLYMRQHSDDEKMNHDIDVLVPILEKYYTEDEYYEED